MISTTMLIAIICGVVAGLLGFAPLFIATRLVRKSESTQSITLGLYGLGGSCVSLIVVAALLVVCAVVNRGMVAPFAIAEILTLVVSTSVYVVYKNVLAKRKRG
ncbi:MAG: hypothetical protein Q4F23_01130 [Coriobacteriia bacterium]|nr:hypothetical protein [Coriobacteriia bacterium]